MRKNFVIKQIKNNEGITLIALVITIIVLLILAGISILTLTGQNGLLSKGNDAVVKNSHSQVREGVILKNTENITINKIEGKNTTIVEFLQASEILGKDPEEPGKYIIDTEKLLGNKMSLGNGSYKDGKFEDVYVFEEYTGEVESGNKEGTKLATTEITKIAEAEVSEVKYKVMYYDKNSEPTEILDLGNAQKTDTGTDTDTETDTDDMSYKVKLNVMTADGRRGEPVLIQILDGEDKAIRDKEGRDTFSFYPFEPEILKFDLIPGVEYRIHVSQNLDGYELPEDIIFQVSENEKDVSYDIQIYPEMESSIIVSLTNVDEQEEVLSFPGAQFYVALFLDEAREEMYGEPQTITFEENQATASVRFTGLPFGHIYYISEVDESGRVIESGEYEGGVYSPKFAGGDNVEITRESPTGWIAFQNLFSILPELGGY